MAQTKQASLKVKTSNITLSVSHHKNIN